MNKWIDQEACKTLKLSVTNLNPMELDAFIKGAQAVLARVKDILADSKASDLGYPLREWDMGRNALRDDILKRLKD